MADNVKITIDNVDALLSNLMKLGQKDLLVGIPSERAERQPDAEEKLPVNNAILGYIHEFGAPEMNIPARPFLVPGIRNARERIISRLRSAAKTAASPRASEGAADKALEAAGILAVTAVQAKITEGPFTPLSKRTLQARARKGRVGAKAELERMKDMGEDYTPDLNNARPLIDTGQLRRAITFVLRKRSK